MNDKYLIMVHHECDRAEKELRKLRRRIGQAEAHQVALTMRLRKLRELAVASHNLMRQAENPKKSDDS